MTKQIDELMQIGMANAFSAKTKTEKEKALRTALEAALKPVHTSSDVREPDVLGAIINGRTYADRLENDYRFECEAGPLRLCSDWVEFRRCFEWLAEHTAPPAQTPVPPRLTDAELLAITAKPLHIGNYARAIETAVRKQFGVTE